MIDSMLLALEHESGDLPDDGFEFTGIKLSSFSLIKSATSSG